MSADTWDDWADGWDDNPAARAYASAAFASLHDELGRRGQSLQGARVLDFGCGTGLLTEQLADRVGSVDAVDLSPKMLAVLEAKRERHGWSNVTTSLTAPADVAPWDLIVCSSVCSFLDDYPGTLAHLASGLAPGGVFVQWDWEAIEDQDGHGLSRKSIRSALIGAGLDEVEVRTAFSIEVDDQTMAPLLGSAIQP